MTTATIKTFNSNWIVNRKYDLFFFIGSVAFSLFIYAFHLFLGYGLGIESELKTGFYSFIIFSGFFDLPHNLQTYSRLFLDKAEHQRHKVKIIGGLIGFIILGEVSIFLKFSNLVLQLAALFGIWHILRQNLGFLKMYKGLNDDRKPFDNFIDLGLYYSLIAAGVLMYPFRLIGLIVFLTLLATFILRQAFLLLTNKPLNLQKLLFMSATLPLYCVLFFILKVPILLFIAIDTIYHDIQYQGWIRFYQKHRFPEDPKLPNRWFRNTMCLSIVVAFFPLISGYCVSQNATSITDMINFEQKLFTFFNMPIFMLIFYHYYIDGVIWRLRESPELREIVFKKKTV